MFCYAALHRCQLTDVVVSVNGQTVSSSIAAAVVVVVVAVVAAAVGGAVSARGRVVAAAGEILQKTCYSTATVGTIVTKALVSSRSTTIVLVFFKTQEYFQQFFDPSCTLLSALAWAGGGLVGCGLVAVAVTVAVADRAQLLRHCLASQLFGLLHPTSHGQARMPGRTIRRKLQFGFGVWGLFLEGVQVRVRVSSVKVRLYRANGCRSSSCARGSAST